MNPNRRHELAAGVAPTYEAIHALITETEAFLTEQTPPVDPGPVDDDRYDTRPCAACGHPKGWHVHHRAGTDCGSCDCDHFTRRRWWRR